MIIKTKIKHAVASILKDSGTATGTMNLNLTQDIPTVAVLIIVVERRTQPSTEIIRLPSYSSSE